MERIDLETPSGECDDQRINESSEFESKEEAFEFYKEYAKSIGFNAIIKASRRSRMSGKFIDAKFVCTRYGGSKQTDEAQARKRGRTNRSWSKTDCKACLHVNKRQDGKWVIRTLIKEHNHDTIPCQVSSISESCGREKIVKESRKFQALEDGDVERLLSFFTDMQAENPFFFYAIDQSLRNIFWVDAKGRLDYTCFSDVVSIDTTFIKNEYKLPLVSFIGVNHHGQFLLLGCGLLLNDESTSGFVWLFKSWLKAMHGCQPRVILTRQDQMLKEAVSEALPSSRHCFYTWDTLGQIPEKLGHVSRQEKGFMDEMNEAIYGSCNGDEFEKKWFEVVDRFRLRDNLWLHSLYEDREHWVPVYMRDVSFAGMCTDGVRSVFDKYIQRKTTLRAFLDQYKTMIQERYDEEERAEIETLCKQPGLKSPSPFGKQMAELYTREMFKKFQVEVLGGVACHPKKESEEGDDGNKKMTFRVQDYEQNRGFVVVWTSESSEVVCSCRLFEFKGFLCRHAMIVLQMSGELTIPSKYVLKRWTKDARSSVESDLIDGGYSTKAKRYTDLCLRSLKLCEEASLSEESYNAVMSVWNEAFRSCENNTGNVMIQSVEESVSDVAQNHSRHEEHNNNNSFNENVADTRQEHSLHEVWKETALQEQRNRYSILDDYLSAQQMSHEMGQINMMTSNRNGYSTANQNIHSLGQSITQQRLYGTQEQLNFRAEVMYERLQDMVKDLN